MKIDQQPLDDHQVRLTVEVENAQLESARKRAARKIAQQVKIPGFRPGKAPYSVIERQVGPEAIEDEALDIVLDDVYPKVIEETGIKPWGPGTLEKVDEDKEPRVFEFRVPLSPTVELGDYKKIRIPFEEKPVTEKDIQGVIDNLREQQAVLEPVERAAQEGDMVHAVISGERDKADHDGNTALLAERRYPVIIESQDVDTSNEWPFPGFSHQLIGLRPGDKKTLRHAYSKDSSFEELRGAAATFKINVEEIKDRILPELNDDFAKSLGDYENLAQLREEIEKSLRENFESRQNEEYDNQIVDAIVEGSTIKFAPQMLDHEIEHYIEDLQPQLASQGMDLDTYLKSRQMELDDLKTEVRPRVEERLKRSLVLMEVSKAEGSEVSEDEVAGIVQEKIARIQTMVPEDEARRLFSGDSLQGMVSRTITEEIIDRTLQRLRQIAKGKAAKAKPEGKPKSKVAAAKSKPTKSPKTAKSRSQKKKE